MYVSEGVPSKQIKLKPIEKQSEVKKSGFFAALIIQTKKMFCIVYRLLADSKWHE